MTSVETTQEVVPFLFGFFETARVEKSQPQAQHGTQFTTASGGRETEWDDDP